MSIGLLVGATPWALDDHPQVQNPIVTVDSVTDVPAAFVADPFALHHQGQWYLFYEVMNRQSGKGEIALSTSNDLRSWDYQGVVLAEPFHLSYPAVYVDDDGKLWMIPETWESGSVRLYEPDPFPGTWQLHSELIPGRSVTDPTLFRGADGGWLMLACSAEGAHNETLLLFEAERLTGPWHEADSSPLVSGDASQARPGGHCFTVDGSQYRLGQDCSSRYGERLRSYPLAPPWNVGGVDVVRAHGDGWRSRGGHHADIHVDADGSLIAFVDGEA